MWHWAIWECGFYSAAYGRKSSQELRNCLFEGLSGHRRLREGKYAAGQLDARWSDETEKDFSKWLNDHTSELPVRKEQVQELLAAFYGKLLFL